MLHADGLLESPLDSTGLMRWGGGGGGSWVRIYANRDHVFAVIAGLRWDTSYSDDGDRTGLGWTKSCGRPAASGSVIRSGCERVSLLLEPNSADSTASWDKAPRGTLYGRINPLQTPAG